MSIKLLMSRVYGINGMPSLFLWKESNQNSKLELFPLPKIKIQLLSTNYKPCTLEKIKSILQFRPLFLSNWKPCTQNAVNACLNASSKIYWNAPHTYQNKTYKHQNGWNWKRLHTFEIDKVKISLLQQPKNRSPNFPWNTTQHTNSNYLEFECKYDFHALSSTFVKISCHLLHFDLCIVETHGLISNLNN